MGVLQFYYDKIISEEFFKSPEKDFLLNEWEPSNFPIEQTDFYRIVSEEILKKSKMIYEDKSIDPASILLSGGGNIAPFIAGKYPMIVGASYVASDLDVAAKEKGLNWTSLPLPTGTVSNMQGANPQTLSVSAQSKYPKQSAAFIRYMMGDQNLTSLSLFEALIPATTGAAKEAQVIKKDSPGWTQILNDAGALAAAPFVLVPNYQKWRDTVAQPTWQQWVQGKITKDEMVKRLLDGWANLR